MQAEAFPQLVETYYAALYRFALSLAKNSSDAGDLTQQTFFVWATKGGSLRDDSKVKSWLFTTLYREFLRSQFRVGGSRRHRLLIHPGFRNSNRKFSHPRNHTHSLRHTNRAR